MESRKIGSLWFLGPGDVPFRFIDVYIMYRLALSTKYRQTNAA